MSGNTSIRENQYGAVDVNDPEKVINMPLERNGESYLERYTLIDEKDAMERASKYTVNENGITVNKGVKDGE